MPRPPNDYERRRPARTTRRTSRASASLSTISPTSSGKVVAFPVADTHQAKGDAAPFSPEIQPTIDMALSVTPLELLAVIIKAKLGDRIEDEEVRRICQVYVTALMTIWGDEEE